MSRSYHFLVVFTTAGILTFSASAQPPAGPGGPGGVRPVNPLARALDTDGDGEISAAELEKATASLKALDRNNDGKLTDDELRPPMGGGGQGGGRGGPGGFGGPGAGDRGGPGEGPGGGAAPNVDEIVARYLTLDANKDGKLTKEEVPERLQGFLSRGDADNDGVVTKDELTKMAERQAAGSGGRGGPGGGGPAAAGGPGGGGRGGPGGGQFGGGQGQFGGPGRGGPGQGGPGQGPGGFGPPNPQAFIERAMEFDADKDGKLSKEELAKMAESMGPGRGGRGGPPQP